MTDEAAFKLEVVAPVLPVTNMRNAVDYYSNRLLFTVGFEWSDAEQEPPRYAVLQQGNTELHLTLSDQPRPAVVYIFVDNVQAYHNAVKDRQASISEEIRDYPWQMREFEATDPDGNRIVFGEHLSRIEKREA